MSLIFVHFWEEIDHQRKYLPLFPIMYAVCYIINSITEGVLYFIDQTVSTEFKFVDLHYTHIIKNTYHKFFIINLNMRYILTLGQYHIKNHHIHGYTPNSFPSVIKISNESSMHPLYLYLFLSYWPQCPPILLTIGWWSSNPGV